MDKKTLLKNIGVYLRYAPHIIGSITVHQRYILPLVKAYFRGVIKYILYGQLFGLDLSRDSIVRLHGKYFIVRKHTNDLNFLSPFSESRELHRIIYHIRKLKNMGYKRIIFIDVGAHIGKYSIILSDLVDKVIALEPDPRNYFLLRKNIEINKIPNIIPLRIAASSKEQDLYIICDKAQTAQSHVVEKIYKRGRALIYKTKATTLDYLVEKLGLENTENIYVLKIDVEGHELDVLLGAKKILCNTNIALIETNYRKISFILNMFRQISFKYFVEIFKYPSTLNILIYKIDI